MSDKRSVATDALETLGTIIGEGVGRDAIHLAVEPVIAGERLLPGMDIGLVNGKAFETGSPVGIVDPFLKNPVAAGEKFWLVVYPRQITSLRHVWSHPAFEEPSSAIDGDIELAEKVAKKLMGKAPSEKWMKDFVDNLDTSISYQEILQRAGENDGGMTFGDDISGGIPDEFWDHAEIILGKKLTRRAEYFSCAC